MKLKRQGIIVLFLFLTFITPLIFSPVSLGTAVNYNTPFRAGVGPTIDGTITATEWLHNANYTITFKFNGTENPEMSVTLYLLHNGSALFIGLNVTSGDAITDPEDAFYIYFDENHNGFINGTTTHPNEEGAKLTRDGNFTDLCYNGTWINQLLIVNLTKGPSTGASNGIGSWEFVFISSYDPVARRAKDSPDFDVNLPSDVLEPAVEIGFDIEFYDADLNMTDSFVTLSNRTESMSPNRWDDLVCGRFPYAEPNLLAIWAFIILVMIIPAVLVVYIIIWIRRQKNY